MIEWEDRLPAKCLIIVGPSGAGKSSLEKKLVTLFPNDFYKTISFTTRAPRNGEVDEVDYYFLNQEEFDKTEKVEHITFGDNHYGLAKTEFEQSGKHIICVVEPTGAQQIISYLGKHMPWITPVLIYMDIPEHIRIENMSTGRGEEDHQISLRIKQDDIPIRFEKAELWNQVKYYKRITQLHEDIYMEVLDFIGEFLVHTFYLNMDINDVKFLGRKSWSFLSQADLGIISGNCQYARVIEELPNKIICHMYGLNREKFQTRYNMSQNFIKHYEKK